MRLFQRPGSHNDRRTTRRATLLLWLCVGLHWCNSGNAVAQYAAPSIRALTRTVLLAQVSEESAAYDLKAHRSARRARYLIGVGVGVAASGLFHLLLFRNRHVCGDRERPYYGSSSVAGPIALSAGLSLVAAGTAWLIATRHRSKTAALTTGQKIGVPLTSLGAALGTEAVLATTLLFDTDGFCQGR